MLPVAFFPRFISFSSASIANHPTTMERNLKQAQMPKYALGDRRYLIEKVVVSY